MAKVFVVGMGGQSNLWGQGSTTSQIAAVQFDLTPPHAFIWDKLGRSTVHSLADDGTWLALQEGFGAANPPVIPGPAVPADAIGPEMQLHYKLSQVIDTHVTPIYYIKYARGGLGLAPATPSWSNREAGKAFDLYRDYYWKPAINAIYANGDRPYFLGMCWQHGTKDAALEADANAYQANLEEFMQAMRGETFRINQAPWVLGSMTTIGFPASEPPFQATVRAAFQPIAAKDDRTTWFDTAQRTENGRALFQQHDGEHFDGEGTSDVGDFFAKGLLSRMRRNTPALIPNP